MSWRNVQRKGNNMSLASELRRLLFSGGDGRSQQPEWTCIQCNTPNFMSRGTCRRCACQRKTAEPPAKRRSPTIKVAPSVPRPRALAPWATPEMVEDRSKQLEIAIDATKAAGGCDQAVAKLESELKVQQKHAEKSAEPVSVMQQIGATKGYITRAEKRHIAITDQVAALQVQQAELEKELSDARKRLVAMEAEAARNLNVQPASNEGAMTALEDAVRTLMVAMHSSREQLPPQLYAAVEAVSTILPAPPPSKDYLEEEEDTPGRAERTPVHDSDIAMDDLEAAEDEDDVALLEIARRLKRARRTGPRARSRSRSDH